MNETGLDLDPYDEKMRKELMSNDMEHEQAGNVSREILTPTAYRQQTHQPTLSGPVKEDLDEGWTSDSASAAETTTSQFSTIAYNGDEWSPKPKQYVTNGGNATQTSTATLPHESTKDENLIGADFVCPECKRPWLEWRFRGGGTFSFAKRRTVTFCAPTCQGMMWCKPTARLKPLC